MASIAAPQIPYFLKAWHMRLDSQAGESVVLSSSQFTEPLRMTFNVETRVMLAYWQADVSVYNLNSSTQANVIANQWQFNKPITMGDSISLSAGYQFAEGGAFDPNANLIYKGNVFQPYWTRENVVDYKVTLRCILGLMQDALNFVNLTVASNSTAYDVVNQVAANCGITVGNLDKNTLTQNKFSRGQTMYGRPYSLLSQIAKDNNLQLWVGPNGLNMRSLAFNPNTTPDYAYAPINLPGNFTTRGTTSGIVKQTLIGTPEQTQQGVVFRVLMDAQPKIGDVVQLAAGTAINRLPLQFGSFPSILDQNGIYVVAGIRYVGDTRGRQDDWYTEITALNSQFFPGFLLSKSPTAPNVAN